ncbi:PLP-dependent aminotransferase family protein, partial [Klebsiella pneumoniae]
SNISLAPGKMSAPADSGPSFFRFTPAGGGGDREEPGVKRLGELIREQLA